MSGCTEQPTPERLQQVAQHTYAAIRQREGFLSRLLSDRNKLHRAISECVELANEIDPRAFSEKDFAEARSVLGSVIDALEQYFAKHGNEKDVAQCYFLGHAVNSLKNSRRWIAQGLSPNPAKRPSPAEREQMADDLAAEMFDKLKTA